MLPALSRSTVAARSQAARHLHSSAAARVPLLISPAEYKALVDEGKNVVPLDVSWHMPNSDRSAAAEYLSGPRLPGARRFDLDEVAELRPARNPLSLGHMLPPLDVFKAAAKKAGISDDTHVVVYDTIGIFTAPRGAFTFKAFGHDKVSVLDGGLPRWINEGGEVEVGEVTKGREADYDGGIEKPELVRSYEDIIKNTEKPRESADIVLDVRAHERFTGEAPEPRPQLESGHMPNSLSLPFSEFVEPSTPERPYTVYKSADELRNVLVNGVGGEEAWKDLQENDGRSLVFSCGSGMTASVGWLATQLIAQAEGSAPPKAAIYDESWTGYASRKESPIIKGEK